MENGEIAHVFGFEALRNGEDILLVGPDSIRVAALKMVGAVSVVQATRYGAHT